MQPNMQPLRTPENKEAELAEAELARAEASMKAVTADAVAFLAEGKAAMKPGLNVAAYKAITRGAQQALAAVEAAGAVVEARAAVVEARRV